MAPVPVRDPELDTLVVEHLHELEGASQYLEGIVEAVVLNKIETIVSSFCRREGWEDLWADEQWALAPRAWRNPGASKNAFPVNFSFGYISGPDGEEDAFFLTSLLSLGQARMGFYWTRPSLGKQKWRQLIDQHPNFLDELRQLRWEYDAKDTSLYLPVRVEQAKLAAGLRNDDLEDALEPLAAALPRLQQSVPVFEPILAAIEAD